MSCTDAEIQTSSARSTEIGEDTAPFNPGREGWDRVTSPDDGSISERTARTTGSRANPDFLTSVTGGILDQLILDAEDQLGEARACVEWYKNKEEEQLKRLDNLRRLRNLEQHQPEFE